MKSMSIELRNQLVQEALDEKWVDEVLRQYVKTPHLRCIPYEDLAQIGNMAILSAASTFDSTRGNFKPYACIAARNAVYSALKSELARAMRTIRYETIDNLPGKQDISIQSGDSCYAALLRAYRSSYYAPVRKGLTVIIYLYRGYSFQQISERTGYNIPKLNAFRLNARKYMEQDSSFWDSINMPISALPLSEPAIA